MKRSTSRFSLVFVLAVAAYFVFFHFKPEGSTSSPPGQGSAISSAGAEENKTAQVSQGSRKRELSRAEKRNGVGRLSSRPARPTPGDPMVRNWAGGQRPANRATTQSGFVPVSSSRSGAGSGQQSRTRVSSALAELLASYEADHDVEAEIPVIIQSDPDSYDSDGAPAALAQARPLEQVNAQAGRMSVKELRRLMEQGDASYITLDMPLHATGHPETVADDFDSGTDYTGNDGSVNWSNNWQEAGESDGSNSGLVQVVNDSYCASGSCLYLGDYNESSGGAWTLTRRADLSGSTSATFSYHYAFESRSNEGFLKVQVRGGGGTWTTLTTYVIEAGVDVSGASASYDISSQIASDTELRFLLTRTDPLNPSSNEVEGYFYIDNVQIQFESDSGAVSPGSSALLATIGLEQVYSGSSAQNQIGYNGQGIGVAVFDSGVSDNTDLSGSAGS